MSLARKRYEPTAEPRGPGRQRGFSMFELVIYILLVSILLVTVLNRYRDLPGEAERANFTAILAQLNAAVNLQMMRLLTSGNRQQADELEGMNPMELMLTTPDNYLGAFASVDQASLPRRSWYFDVLSGELVYLADDAADLYLLAPGQRIPTGSVRFRIRNVYGSRAIGEAGTWQGLVLAPVVPYEWQAVPLELQVAQP